METRGDMQCESTGFPTNAGQFASPCKNSINRKFTHEVAPHRPVLKVQYNSHHRSSAVSRDTRIRTIVRGYSRSSSRLGRSARARECRFSDSGSMWTAASRARAIRQREGAISASYLAKDAPTRRSVYPCFGRYISFSSIRISFFDCHISFLIPSGRIPGCDPARCFGHNDVALAALVVAISRLVSASISRSLEITIRDHDSARHRSCSRSRAPRPARWGGRSLIVRLVLAVKR